MKTLAIWLSILCCAIGLRAQSQGSLMLGAAEDTFHSPAAQCMFVGALALNPPCMALYSTPTIGTFFYGYAGLPFDYSIPVPNGNCDISLGMWEPNKTGPGQRKFTITVGAVAKVVDIFASAGLKNFFSVAFPGILITDGHIHINFSPIAGNAGAQVVSWQCVPPPPAGLTGDFDCPSGIHLAIVNGEVTEAMCEAPPTLAACAVVAAPSGLPAAWVDAVYQAVESPTAVISCVPGPDKLTVVLAQAGDAMPVGVYVPMPMLVAAGLGLYDNYQLAVSSSQPLPILLTCSVCDSSSPVLPGLGADAMVLALKSLPK